MMDLYKPSEQSMIKRNVRDENDDVIWYMLYNTKINIGDDSAVVYSMVISRYPTGDTRLFVDLSDSYEKAVSLFNQMADNGVDPVHASDVIGDLL